MAQSRNISRVSKIILLLPKWYPNKLVPLNGNFLENHAIAISKERSIAVLFVRPDENLQGSTYQLDFSDEHHFPVIRVYYRKCKGWLKWWAPFRYFRAQRIGYREVLRRYGQPQLCHVHVMARSGMLALFLKWTQGIPLVISEHWTGYVNGRYGGLKKLATNLLVSQSNGISTVTEYLAAHMQKAGISADYKIIPNAVDTDAFQPSPPIPSEKMILHISDLKDDHKNISGLIRACKMLTTKRTDFKVCIVGEGPDRDELLNLCSRLEMDAFISFQGELKGDELKEMLRTCSFLSLFSHYETFGVVLIEALATGKPVVASNLPAIQEFITDEQGILVVPGNEENLAKALENMLDRFSTYDPQKLHRYIEQHYSYQQVGRAFSKWYEQQLKNV